MCIYDPFVSWKDERRTYCQGIHNGNILLPDKPGQFPVLFLFHGQGSAQEWQNNGIIKNLNSWIVKYGLMPMVVVMPSLPTNKAGRYDSDCYYNYIRNYFADLIAYVEDRYSDYIIHDAHYHAVAGASMGGAGALYTGVLFNKYFMHIGAFSPSQQLHYGENRGWIRDSADIQFNRNVLAIRHMGYSLNEPPEFSIYVTNYSGIFQKNGFNFTVWPVEDKGHCYSTFNHQLQNFLAKLFKKDGPL